MLKREAPLCPPCPKHLHRLPWLCPAPPGLRPVVPVEEFEVLIVGDVYVIDLPGALVIGQVLPLDQVMDVSLFIKAVTQGTES